MKEIKCPKCGSIIKVDDTDFAVILNQVRTEEFNAELERRIKDMTKAQKAEEAKRAAETNTLHQRELSGKEQEIAALKQQIAGWEESKRVELEAAKLKARQEVADTMEKKDSEITRLRTEAANEKQNALVREQALKDKFRAEKEGLEKEVDLYKNFKAKRSVKLLGEDLEQHCYNLYNQTLLPVMPNATFEKDNEAVKEDGETKGSKGDFIFRDKEDGVEYISIMFEMKNEGDETTTKHKNADFFDKLDRDRKKKGCEFAVLVSMLELDNEMYNNGIVVAPGYEKMYVVRPDNFLSIVTLLIQTSKNALEAKKQLVAARNQSADLSHFEDQLNAFREGFGKNVLNAKKKYDEAIKGIDNSIKTLEGIKKALQVSAGHLGAAENKVESLTVKKLSKGNPTVAALLKEVQEKKVAAESPDEQ